MIILVDCDGVLSDFNGAFLREFRVLTGMEVQPSEIDKWELRDCDFFKTGAERVGSTVSSLYRAIGWRIAAEGFCYGMEPLPRARVALNTLRADGHEIYCVTSPWASSKTWVHERTEWLEMKMDFRPGEVVSTHAKQIVDGDLFIDDKPSNVEKWLDWSMGRAWEAGVLFEDRTHSLNMGTHLNRGGWKDILAWA